MPITPVVLLDRDGTINVDRHYLSKPEQVELLPNVAAGLRKLRSHDCPLVVVTNQSGVARGLISPADLERVHGRLVELLMAEGIELAGIYACPHHAANDCACRKPRTGLVEQAARELGFDPAASFMVGDKRSDIELGQRVGATTILVRTGYGAETATDRSLRPDYVSDDLLEAAAVIAGLLHERD